MQSAANLNIPGEQRNHVVSDYWNHDTRWKVESSCRPRYLLLFAGKRVLPTGQRLDIPNWALTTHETFSVQFVRTNMLSPQVNPPHNLWLTVWKFKGPMRASLLVWLLLHDGLPTAELLWKRKILSSLRCCWCNQTSQSIIHLLRDCTWTKGF